MPSEIPKERSKLDRNKIPKSKPIEAPRVMPNLVKYPVVIKEKVSFKYFLNSWSDFFKCFILFVLVLFKAKASSSVSIEWIQTS